MLIVQKHLRTFTELNRRETMIKLQPNQAYWVLDCIYGEEYYAYFDGEKVLVHFPSPAPGMKRHTVKLLLSDFLANYEALEECPEAKQIFTSDIAWAKPAEGIANEVTKSKAKAKIITKEEWLKIKEQKEREDMERQRDEDGHGYYKDMF